MNKKILLSLFWLLLAALPAIAQVTSSSITGFVLDETGKGLPGATVQAVHQPSGSVYGTATERDGSFIIQNMRVGGPYTIDISYLGYQKQTVSGVVLTLGEPYNVSVKMVQSTATMMKEVNVTSNRNSILNNQRTGATTNVGRNQMATLPTVSRNLTDFTRLSPQGGSSFGGNLNNSNSFGGRDGRYNNVQINGANINNAFGISSSLMPGGFTQPISMDALEELQIGIAPYDVRQSSFTGANINAITRSGTNEFTGSAYMFWRNQNFNGVHVGDQDLPPAAAQTNNIYGARIGGPIIKNKLFFFVNAEQEKNVYPGVIWVAKRNGATGNVSRVPASTLDSLQQYLRTKYGYDPGAYENYGNTFTNKGTKALARIDWNINKKHKFYISYSHLKTTEDQQVNGSSSSGVSPGVTNARISQNALTFENSNYKFEHTVQTVSAELTSNFSSKLSNQLLGTYVHIQDIRKSPSSPFPFVDIAATDLTGVKNTTDNYISFGYELFSYNNDLKNNNLNIIDNITYVTGKHTITAGAAFEYLTFSNSFQRLGTGYYRYASVSDFMNDRAPVAFGYTYPYSVSSEGNPQAGDAYVNLRFGLGSIYAQDKWNLTPRFTLTYGIRAELPFYFNKLPANQYIDTLSIPDKDGNRTHYDVSKWPKQRLLVSPRIGFNWDVYGNRNLQLRGGTGIFSGKVPFVWFTNQPGNTGTLINTVAITDAATLNQMHFNPDPKTVVNQFPSRFPQQAGSSVPGEIDFVSPDFKMPQIWRTNIAADFKLPYGLIGTAEAIFTKDLIGVYQRNANLPKSSVTLNNGADQRPYYPTTASSRVYSNVSGIYVLENTTKGQSFQFTIGAARPARKGFYGSLYYTATYSEDVSSNPGSTASSAWNGLPNTSTPNEQVLSTSEYLTPHRVIGTLSYRFEYLKHLATTLSVVYEGASQGRFSYRYTSDINKDGVNADLIYIPNQAEELQWDDIKDNKGNIVFTRQQQIEAFNAYMAQDKYMDKHRGQYAGRYAGKYPFYSRFDVKLLQDLFTNIGKRRATLQFSLDMLNIGNFINPKWGVQKALVSGSGNNANILSVARYDAQNHPVYNLATAKDNNGNTVLPTTTFRNDLNTFSTWGMQMGLRLIF